MANRKITDLTALVDPATDDVLPIVDVSEGLNANKNKKITYVELFKSIDNGTATAPAIAFNASANTGIYRSAANELSIATAGGQAIKVESNNKTTIYGDLVVTGSQTTISSTTIDVADKNIQLATGNSSDAGADGGGLTLKGATDKTWNWVDSTDAWTANQHIDITTGKVFKIAGTQVLNATTLGSGIVNSSLTSVGTLGSLTVTNAVTAGSLDISGGADIDGTLEADAYTVNGTALNEYIADTVGAMVSSNTETNITVTYDDSDNTLDFVIGTLNQDTTGNAATATALQTARTIGGVSFNGTANINLPGVNQTGNQNTTGSAATLTTARTIGGVSFDGSANINLPGVNAAGNQNTSGTAAGLSGTPTITVNDVIAASLDISGNADIDGTLEADAYTVNGTALNEYIADTVGAMVSSNTETNITVTYDDADNTLDFVIGTLNQNTTGNAATATALQTARTIGGVSFDGTGNITLPGVNATGNQNTTGSAATLTTARTIGGVSFNGSANIDLPGVNTAGNQNTSGTAANLSGTPNITVGDVVAASLDISGNVDIDGTLEADALTIDGTSLSETIADTVGAMVSSNTETGITVTYDDADNTLDFVVGTLNQNTTGNAATATALQNARTINGVSFDGTGNITVTAAAGTLTGSTLASGVTASSLTSVGTLAGLTTSSDVVIQNQKDIRFSEASGNGTNYVALQAPAAISSNYTLTLPSADGSSGQHLKTDGSGNLSWETPVSAASDLTGSTLASGVTASSLTSVGTLTGLTTSGNILMTGTGCIDVAAGTTAQRPGSPNAGMFRYNTTLSKFEGHDGSAWGEIGGGGGGASFYINTLSSSSGTGGGSATFNGTAYRFQLSNAPATGNAAQMLVSVGGVIQKANSGTSQPSEGYAIDGNDIIFGAAPASAASWFIITYGALNAGEPTDNTVNEAKLQVSNSPTNGYFLSAQSGNTGGLTWAAVDLSSKLSLTGGTLTGNVKLNDSIKTIFGSDDDAYMMHNGSHQYNRCSTGYYHIQAQEIRFNKADGNETLLKAISDGAVELYHNNFKSFKTAADGIFVYGPEGGDGILKLYADEGDDNADKWRFVSGTDGSFYLQNFAGGTWEKSLKASGNGNVELYYNHSKKFETTTTGTEVISTTDALLKVNNTGDGTATLMLHNTGSTDFQLALTNAVLTIGTTTEASIKATANGDVELYYDNSKKFQTTSSGVHCFGQLEMDGNNNIDLQDNGALLLGNSDDLQIFHDGNNSQIREEGTGNLMLISNNEIRLEKASPGEAIASFNVDGACELYYDNSKKFETTSSGISVTGNILPSGYVRVGDGQSLYVGSSNDLQIYHDGTNSHLKNSTGTLIFRSDNYHFIDKDNGDVMMKLLHDGAVELYYNNTKRFDTNNGGAACHGAFTVHGELGIDNGADNHKYMDVRLGSSVFWIRGTSGGDSNHENMIGVQRNGRVELHYDASKKFETTSEGAKVHGHLRFDDSKYIKLGTGVDVQMFHNGSNFHIQHLTSGSTYMDSVGSHNFRNADGTEYRAKFVNNGAVELYHDNSKKFHTTSYGAVITGKLFFADSSSSIEMGDASDLKLYHNGSHSYIWNTTGDLQLRSNSLYVCSTSGEAYLDAAVNGAISLYYDNVKHFETTSIGCKISDNDTTSVLQFANSAGANGYVMAESTNIIGFKDNNPDWLVRGIKDGTVELYYDGTKKFQTRTGGAYVYGKGGGTTFTAAQAMHADDRCGLEVQGELTGIKIASTYNDNTHPEYGLVFVQGPSTSSYNCWSISPDGPSKGNGLNFHYGAQSGNIHVASNCKVTLSGAGHFFPYTNNASDLGTSSKRWRNIYTTDLHLSNKGKTNKVDGTWGDWTLQEGEEDVFMINNRSGKKYKMALQEVS